jgi:hypothetical protein
MSLYVYHRIVGSNRQSLIIYIYIYIIYQYHSNQNFLVIYWRKKISNIFFHVCIEVRCYRFILYKIMMKTTLAKYEVMT